MRLPFWFSTFCSFAFLLLLPLFLCCAGNPYCHGVSHAIEDLEEWEVNPEWMSTLKRSRNDLCTMRQGIKEIEEVSETMQGKSR